MGRRHAIAPEPAALDEIALERDRALLPLGREDEAPDGATGFLQEVEGFPRRLQHLARPAPIGLAPPGRNLRVLHRARQRYKDLYLERLETVGRVRAGVVLGWLLAAGASIRLLGSLKG